MSPIIELHQFLILRTILSVVGTTSVALSDHNVPFMNTQTQTSTILFQIGMALNVVLNLFVTFNIIIRLMLHRRLALAVSPTLTKNHLRISGILLESAVINVLPTIFAIFGFRSKEIHVPLVRWIVVPGQV